MSCGVSRSPEATSAPPTPSTARKAAWMETPERIFTSAT
jgi:hypothetical protein